ncbi:uncharacterized protein LOC126610481 [Malus sylvestris]|uniref:uncharacterized protein LOC126610481 n=1 Tax=Malus sylvestris TaxID=3752 RepID=UPI0021ABDA52|nr:uncharacterized protein LOC126610481 [Malus sylvestris]
MGAASSTTIVPQILDGEDDYKDWSVRVKTYLLSKDLWDVVESEPLEQEGVGDIKAWRKNNAEALHVIQLTCGPRTFPSIRDEANAKAAWDTLETLFNREKPKLLSMAAVINPVEYTGDYDPWFEAVSRRDWCKAKEFLTQHPGAITATDSMGNTALHKATYKGNKQIVEELVQLMTEEQLEIKNNNHETALTIAAAENIKIVECLVAKNKKLLGIAEDGSQLTPILIAAKNDRWDIVRHLYSVTPLEDLKPDKGRWGSELVCYCLQAKQFATYKGNKQIVEELVQLMTEEQLEIKNNNHETALTIAAAENIKIVECLVAKNKKLLGIAEDGSQLTPILIAAKNDRWDIVRHLYSVTPLEDLKPDKGRWGSELVCYCLQAKQFDIAWDLLGRCPRLSYTQGLTRCPLYEYALLPIAFPSGTSFKFWQRWIYKCIHVKHALSVVDVRINVQNQENEQDKWNRTDLGLLQGLPSWLSEFLGINHICELKLHHVRSREILDIAYDLIKDLKNEEMPEEMTANRGLRDTLLLAAQNGIVELVTTVCKARPELLKGTYGKPIFHRAVEHRQENVYSLIYGISKTYDLATLKDNSGNSMLHYAGMLSPLEKLNGVAGPALQMQRERQWYKEVESFVVTATGASTFEEHILIAARLFTKNHKELHKKGEKWMKATSSSYTVVNALIVTIMFAAAFTVPGGNNPETGYPIFLNKKLFMVFIVLDAISLFSSATSALMFLGIHISRYAEDDFLTFLPTKMITGISTLFISILAMMVAFSSALFIMLQHKSLIITSIIAFASVPVIYFIWMHFPLLFEILLSTYGGGLFNKKCKRWINV